MDQQILIELDMKGALIAWLVLGHVMADFVFQTHAMVKKKKSSFIWLSLHGLEVTAVQLVFLLPFFSYWACLAAIIIGLLHMMIDALKIGFEKKWDRPFLFFNQDQVLHLVVLVVLVEIWFGQLGGPNWLLPWMGSHQKWMIIAPVLAAGLIFNAVGGSVIVSAVLRGLSANGHMEQEDVSGMGRTVGYLERTILILLVLQQQWTAIGFVIAAKSIARFKELEQRSFSEYYLIGTLTSLVVAIGTGLAVKNLI